MYVIVETFGDNTDSDTVTIGAIYIKNRLRDAKAIALKMYKEQFLGCDEELNINAIIEVGKQDLNNGLVDCLITGGWKVTIRKVNK